MSQETLEIKHIGDMGTGVQWFDFEKIPQGYIHLCGTGVPKPKRSRKFPHINGTLIDPTDEQVIDYAKKLMRHSEKNPDNYNFKVIRN